MHEEEQTGEENVNKSVNEVDLSETKIEGNNNSIGTVKQSIQKESPEIPLQNNEQYNGFVVFYRFLCRYIPNDYESPFFGVSGVLGLLALGFKVYTTTGFSGHVFFDWMYWVSGIVAIYGIGYFLVEGDCEKCGSRFTLINTHTCEIDRQERAGKVNRIKIRKVYECEHCEEEYTDEYWTTEDQSEF